MTCIRSGSYLELAVEREERMKESRAACAAHMTTPRRQFFLASAESPESVHLNDYFLPLGEGDLPYPKSPCCTSASRDPDNVLLVYILQMQIDVCSCHAMPVVLPCISAPDGFCALKRSTRS